MCSADFFHWLKCIFVNCDEGDNGVEVVDPITPVVVVEPEPEITIEPEIEIIHPILPIEPEILIDSRIDPRDLLSNLSNGQDKIVSATFYDNIKTIEYHTLNGEQFCTDYNISIVSCDFIPVKA